MEDDYKKPSDIEETGKLLLCMIGTPILFNVVGAWLVLNAPVWFGQLDVCCFGTFLGWISGATGGLAWILAGRGAAQRAAGLPVDERYRTSLPPWLAALVGAGIMLGMMGGTMALIRYLWAPAYSNW